MHVMIDRDGMRFIASHSQPVPLRMLSNVEYPHVSIVITHAEIPADLDMLSDLELVMLYKNTTGANPETSNRRQLQCACVLLAQQVPAFECNPFELEVQAGCIDANDKRAWKYVPGATRPILKTELFDAPVRASIQWNGAEMQALQTAKVRPATLQAAQQRSSPVRPASPAPGAIPKGGNRAIIWKHMDQLWQASGNPSDLRLVLALRKQCMDQLHSQGVNRSTASCELGAWQKERLAQN